MTMCLKQERLARRQRNFEMAKERKEKLNQKFKEQAKMKEDNVG